MLGSVDDLGGGEFRIRAYIKGTDRPELVAIGNKAEVERELAAWRRERSRAAGLVRLLHEPEPVPSAGIVRVVLVKAHHVRDRRLCYPK